MNINKLIEEYKEILLNLEVCEKISDSLNKKKDYIESVLMYYMDVNKINEFKVDDERINKIKTSVSVYSSVSKINHETLKDFLGEETNLVFTEKPDGLRKWVNKQIDDNKELPEFINLFLKEEIKVTKKRGNKNE